MTGFRDKLSGQKKQHRENGLVWRGDAAARRLRQSPAPTFAVDPLLSSQHHAAHVEGRRAGSTIVLHRGLSRGPESRGRLLGSG